LRASREPSAEGGSSLPAYDSRTCSEGQRNTANHDSTVCNNVVQRSLRGMQRLAIIYPSAVTELEALSAKQCSMHMFLDKPHSLQPTWSGLLRVVSATIALSWPTVVTPGSTVTGALAPSVVYTSSCRDTALGGGVGAAPEAAAAPKQQEQYVLCYACLAL
jgi:hypothetical protein